MLTIIPELLSPDDLAAILPRMADANWTDGAETAHGRAKDMKHNLQLLPNDELGKDVAKLVLDRMAASAHFTRSALPERILPPMVNCYREGGSYGPHSDRALMAAPDGRGSLRTDLSATVFLCDPESYDGGELVIDHPFGTRAVKLKAGAMVVYPSSTLHWVKPVTRGQRICAVTWIESAVPDPEKRALIEDLALAIINLREVRPGEAAHLDRLNNVRMNLIRMWSR